MIISFTSQQDLQQAAGVLKALNIPHAVGKVTTDEALRKLRHPSRSEKLRSFLTLEPGDFKAIKSSKRCAKPFKLREYPVTISATTNAKAQEILPLLKAGLGNAESSMRIIGTVMQEGAHGAGVDIKFTVRYGVRGNCPADVRGRINRLLESIDTTATVTVGTPKNLLISK